MRRSRAVRGRRAGRHRAGVAADARTGGDPAGAGTRQRTALRAREDFLGPGRLIAAILDYDLPFIPVVTASPPIRIGMCVPLSWSAPRAYGRERRSPETEAVDVAPAEPGTLLPGGVPPTAPTR